MNESPVERSAAGVRATGESPSASVTSVSDIGLKRALAVAEEAAFLWVSRSAVARSSAVTFDVLARMDQRLSRLVYKLSERPALAAPFLQHDPAAFESGLTFVTAIVALRGRVVDVFDQLLARLESEPDLLSPSHVRADLARLQRRSRACRTPARGAGLPRSCISDS
jgi:hypothetical protein